MKTKFALKGWAPTRDEMIARLCLTLQAKLVRIAQTFGRTGIRLLDTSHDTFCHFNFRVPRSTCQIFDGVAVVIARGKIHVGKAGVVAENFVYEADTFK